MRGLLSAHVWVVVQFLCPGGVFMQQVKQVWRRHWDQTLASKRESRQSESGGNSDRLTRARQSRRTAVWSHFGSEQASPGDSIVWSQFLIHQTCVHMHTHTYSMYDFWARHSSITVLLLTRSVFGNHVKWVLLLSSFDRWADRHREVTDRDPRARESEPGAPLSPMVP